MNQVTHEKKYLKEYAPPRYLVDEVYLKFELSPGDTLVTSRLKMRRNPLGAGGPFELYGENLIIESISIDGVALNENEYGYSDDILTVAEVPLEFTFQSSARIAPKDNTALEGLYLSSGNYVTQCEAEGFRRITFYPDRPDVMSIFTTEIIADKSSCPVLLSNGNRVEEESLEDGRHRAVWHDPFPKPSYLFALVAGNLAFHEDHFITASGREVTLRIYVEPHNREKTSYAMESLKRAMKWDEERFGREYDLDIFMIVAVDDFNMGAMENKGLNVFNSKYVLADDASATDTDFERIEGVIGHEYFHNWSGNRVTCRDWFQLSLKEGLTVFRDSEFTSDMRSRAVKRIDDARAIRTVQFAEDAGPMAHPVRPDSYIEINNFYTITVYEKGAEVVRMVQTLLGRDAFRRGLDIYFEKYDGMAVTIEDFIDAMEEASGMDLRQFMRWYDQAGTPVVSASMEWNGDDETLLLTLMQEIPPTPEKNEKEPHLIPVAVGLLDSQGRDIPLKLQGSDEATEGMVLRLTETTQSFLFTDVPERPVPSLLRDFSAPVKLRYDYSDDELAHLASHDSDSFNRWDAAQRLALKEIFAYIDAYRQERPHRPSEIYCDVVRKLLQDADTDPALRAVALALPDYETIADEMEKIDVDAAVYARERLRRDLAAAMRDEFAVSYQQCRDVEGAAARRLKNTILFFLAALDDEKSRSLVLTQYNEAATMTDTLGALRLIAEMDEAVRREPLRRFEEKWRHDPLVMDKWMSIQAAAGRENVLEDVKSLMNHPHFSMRNPNRIYSLVGAFSMANFPRFHAADGSGYRFLAGFVAELDRTNPQVASRLLRRMVQWKRYASPRDDLIRQELILLRDGTTLSKDTYEVVHRGLEE